MNTTNTNIPAGNETLACSLDNCDAGKKPSVLFLHGAGPSNKEQVAYVSESFVANGQSVVRFDFSGQGQSSGCLQESSLAKRQAEALAVMDYYGMDADNLTIVGTSMGGYIATSLARIVDIKTLILFCPAAYDVKAWGVQFNKGFTEILRRDISLLRSDIDELLGAFRGRSLLVLAEKDEIIQPVIVDMYQSALRDTPGHRTYIIPDSPHPIHRWLADKPERKEELLREIGDFMNFAGARNRRP